MWAGICEGGTVLVFPLFAVRRWFTRFLLALPNHIHVKKDHHALVEIFRSKRNVEIKASVEVEWVSHTCV